MPLARVVSYENLRAQFRKISHFEEVAAIVGWDQAVNMKGPAGPNRGDAMASLSRLIHDLVTDPRMADWLDQAEEEVDRLDMWEQRNLVEIRRRHTRATALSADLVEATTAACNESELAWRRLRSENDFATYAPYLIKVLDRQRECAKALSEQLSLEPYDALMDAFEPGMTSNLVDQAFAPLRTFLPTFIEQVIERQSKTSIVAPVGPFPVPQQIALAHRMMVTCGLDMERARIDESHHPFCGGVPNDVRITNRYRDDEFLSGLMGVLHESGHGKYEQGLPARYLDQPVGKARGMVAHESQSLLLEMQVSRGRDFLSFLATQIPEFFPDHCASQPGAYDVENLVRLQTRVARSLIRVDADEVTYPAHVMVRYDLEKELIAGSLRVEDLPEAWDEKMRDYLGIGTLGNDRDGCMQDVHWPAGAFGYFPLYTLGAMVAAQLFSSARRDLSDLPQQLRSGDLSQLDQWLSQKVWGIGSSQDLQNILVSATTEPLNPQHFIVHLKSRYGST